MLAFAVLVLLQPFAPNSSGSVPGLGGDGALVPAKGSAAGSDVLGTNLAVSEASFLEAPQASTSSTVRTISVLLGSRSFDSDYDPVDEQVALGLEYDQYSPGSLIGWEGGFSYSSDDGSVAGVGDVEATFWEVYAGVRKTFGVGQLHPYVGGGLSYINVDGDVDTGAGTISDSDSSVGLYLRGGASWDLGANLRLGADIRIMAGTDIDISDVNNVDNADFGQVSLTFGYRL